MTQVPHRGELSEGQVEQELKNRGLTKGPRLTPQIIDDLILHEQYWWVPGTTATVCAMTLKNGHVVIGKSACVAAINFDADMGRKIARDNARDQIWELEGYALKSRLEGLA